MQTEFKGHGPQSAEPSPHPCDDPGLSPTEFLIRVMHDDLFSYSLRVKAAAALTAIEAKAPIPPITIRIKDPFCYEYAARFPGLGINTKTQSKDQFRSDSRQPSSETPPPLYTETNSHPPTLIDYSKPLSPYEIQEIKAAVHALRPDLAHLPIPTPHLCACGHWIVGPCGCPHDRSDTKLN
jgi:hypothetical protein